MAPVDIVQENLPLIIGVIFFVIFTIGLVLAMRTASGRDALAGAAVRLAVAMLALAERWLGGQIGVQADAGSRESQVTLARMQLLTWLARRAEDRA